MKTATRVVAALLFLLLLGFFVNSLRPKIRIDESSHSLLPPSATKICSFYQAFWPYSAVECTIPESDFEELSERNSWKPEEISNPVEVRRFIEAMRISRIEIPKEYESEPSVATIVEGRCFQSEVEPDGGRTLVAFDRRSGRAFFYFGGR